MNKSPFENYIQHSVDSAETKIKKSIITSAEEELANKVPEQENAFNDAFFEQMISIQQIRCLIDKVRSKY